MSRPPAYSVHELRKVYRTPPVVANDGLSFEVRPGEAFGLLGANGAGKTTLVRQLVGLLHPTSGRIELFGEPFDRKRAARTVAYLPQGALAQGEWKAREAIGWMAVLRGFDPARARDEAAQVMSDLGLTELADRQLRKLSGGQRRLVQLAMTLVGRYPVLILDEPTTDIDPALRRRIWALIEQRAREGAAVVLVTHDVAEAEHVLDRVAIIERGKVIAHGTPAELKATLAHRTRIEVVLAEGSPLDPAEVAALVGHGTRIEGRRISGWTASDEAVRTLDKIVSHGHDDAFEDLRLITPTLEDVYLAHREEER